MFSDDPDKPALLFIVSPYEKTPLSQAVSGKAAIICADPSG
jgi:hypothetical protein